MQIRRHKEDREFQERKMRLETESIKSQMKTNRWFWAPIIVSLAAVAIQGIDYLNDKEKDFLKQQVESLGKEIQQLKNKLSEKENPQRPATLETISSKKPLSDSTKH